MSGFPGDGVVTLPAEEAHSFTVHEFARPRAAEVAKAPKDNVVGWLRDLRDDLTAKLAAPDRPIGPEDLVYAATARCRCGAGFVYVKWIRDMHGAWLCSAIVLGGAPGGSLHDQAKPFAFWSIKSENQPSANGATTRPKETTS